MNWEVEVMAKFSKASGITFKWRSNKFLYPKSKVTNERKKPCKCSIIRTLSNFSTQKATQRIGINKIGKCIHLNINK